MTWADDIDTEHVGLQPLNWLKENAYGDDVLTKRATDAGPKVLESVNCLFGLDDQGV